MMNKKGLLGNVQGIAFGIVGAILGLVIVFYLVGGLAPTLVVASGNISNSGLPLANLFASNGILLLIFMVVLLVGMIIMAIKMVKGHGHK